MNVLVVGGGGRESALVWKIAQSPQLDKLYIAPGNPGTAELGENVPIDVMDIPALIIFAKEKSIGLTVVGPENPLGAGIVNFFQERGLKIFGPTKGAAWYTEISKVAHKHLLERAGVPTAPFKAFRSRDRAWDYVEEHGVPVYIKADGPAKGKGAYGCVTMAQARTALTEIMVEKIFGKSGNQVVIEDFIEGSETTLHALCDGSTAKMFPPSHDVKAIYPGGPNTGGMGCYLDMNEQVEPIIQHQRHKRVQAILAELNRLGCPFTGCMYPGLKDKFFLETNARFGDPECQVYMTMLKTDVLDILMACVEGNLADVEIEWKLGCAVCVVLASEGYPGNPVIDRLIKGIDRAASIPGVTVFHAGTKLDGDRLLTAGGRVLNVVGVGATRGESIEIAYQGVDEIDFEGKQYRDDIGQ